MNKFFGRNSNKSSSSSGMGGSGRNKGSSLAFPRQELEADNIRYILENVIGNGSFGVVYRAKVEATGEIVAIKKVLQDKRFKNRELQIMKIVKHDCIVDLRHCFYTNGEDAEEIFLNLVLDYVPDTVHRVCKEFINRNSTMPVSHVKLYCYQIFRSLSYIHSLGICHRDIKPQNLLLNTENCELKLCDFGSAKILQPGEPNVSYICSRYYRAPELIFGSTTYTVSIDVWSTGCVLAEMILGQPLFPGESGVDQLVEIIKVLGTPAKEQIHDMNPSYTEFKFPSIKAHAWERIFPDGTPSEVLRLLDKLLVYSPNARLTSIEVLADSFFDEIREDGYVMPNGAPPPDSLFQFSEKELQGNRHLVAKLIPSRML